MPDDSLTHKDLSTLTGVSETTIKSYRRKFAGFIPLRSHGKPLRFAPESADVCMRIRQCFEQDLSVAEILALLKEEFPHLGAKKNGRSAKGPQSSSDREPPTRQDSVPEAVLHSLSTAWQEQRTLFETLIDKCSTLAEAQQETNLRLLKLQESFADFLSLFLAREDLIGRGLDDLGSHLENHLEHSDSALLALAQEMGSGLEELRNAMPLPLEEKSVLVRNSYGDATRYVFQRPAERNERTERAGTSASAENKDASASGTEPTPSVAFLDAPLVIRSGGGDYLGIAGRSEGAFSLNDLFALFWKSFQPPQHFNLSWESVAGGWILRAEQTQVIRPMLYVLHLEASTTPKGNAVVVLHHLERNGREQPGAHLHTFIRRMRAMVAGEPV